ncbi:MAG: hypothetical protein QOJ12_3463, partial [Thermoleophilales bacterium]|nr:hypothetical protein [Thermoleophilales bacterium]
MVNSGGRAPGLRRARWGALVSACVLVCAFAAPAQAAPVLQPGFELETLASGLGSPAGVAWSPDGGRMFIVEKRGALHVVQNGVRTEILDMTARVNDYGDRGLLGVAVDKNFSAAAGGYVYLLYVVENNPLLPDQDQRTYSRLARIRVNANNTVVNSGPGQDPLTPLVGTYNPPADAPYCPQPHRNDVDCIPADYHWHLIGTVRVDPADGTLWFGSGDGKGQLAADGVVPPDAFRTYDEQTYAGKILHVDANGRGLAGHPYCPAETDTTKVCTKVYASGFRNPFRFVLRGGGKRPVVGDVGLNSREEIDLAAPGRNYGWPCYEASEHTAFYRDNATCTALYGQEGAPGGVALPALDYGHTVDGGAVGAGPVYTGTAYPAAYRNRLYYMDYVQGWIRSAPIDANDNIGASTDFMTGGGTPVDLQVGPDGRLVYVDIWNGTVVKVVHTTGNRAPIAGGGATPTNGSAPLTVAFSSSGSSDPDGDPLSYDWDFGDGSAHSTQPNPSHDYATVGSFTATLTVTDGDRSATKSFAITTANSAPQATISGPSTYRDGSPLTATASATDAQDATLPDSAFKWDVILIHNTHQHFLATASGRSVTFTPLVDHDVDAHYEARLTVTDSGGLTDQEVKRVDPESVQLSLGSTPAGAPYDYSDRATSTMPQTLTTAIGHDANLSAAAAFVKDGYTYTWKSWSNGKARAHAMTVPATNLSLTATYNGQPKASPTAAATGKPYEAAFTASATDPEGGALTYAWSFGDGLTGTGAAPKHTYAGAGTYTATLTVSDGDVGGSKDYTLAPVTVAQNGPAVTMTKPVAGARYRAGAALALEGSATDPQDGVLSGGSLTWSVTRKTATTSTVVATPTGGVAAFTPPTN